MSKSSFKFHTKHSDNFPNRPTEIDNEVFLYFEKFRNFNINFKTNINSTGFFKKKVHRKVNTNSGNSPNYTEDNHNFINSNLEENSKKIFTYEQKGLDDNYFNDIENKRKAKFGLLMMMNNFSGGKFCTEIKDHFDKKKKKKEEIRVITKKDNIKKTYERQNCLESFDNNKEIPKLNNTSDKLSKMYSEIDFMHIKNKQTYNNYKLPLNISKLPKIIEENEYLYSKKKFREDLNEDQLANLYYTVEEIEKLNKNFINGKRQIKLKKEEIRNQLTNNKNESSVPPISNNNNFIQKYNNMNKNSSYIDNHDMNDNKINKNILISKISLARNLKSNNIKIHDYINIIDINSKNKNKADYNHQS